ncbi:hypothetical protein MSNKSG1_02359 [Marinobacter santoriniensis NKSG1]|uniref:Uncharacterized protein n=1 Tax=Marinobacter santoriniensis NKSG1 TaxID=1288826 RepID=M7CV70_9GAMM|nr:hypothetical protein MSNKSG1_02359 [Marinobacter santoriniensis NKSG1]
MKKGFFGASWLRTERADGCPVIGVVLEELGKQLFKTRDSLYQASGEGIRMEAPVESLHLLRAGYSPDQWEAIASFGDKLEGI